jgi:hypothetical protein
MATSKTQEATWEAKQTNGFFPLSLHCVALMASAYSNHGNQPQKRTLMRNSTLFVTEQQLPNVNGITFTTQAFVESKQQPSTTKVNEMTNSQCDHVNESLPTAAESNDNQEPITFTAAESKALIAMYVWGSHSITEAANIFWSDRNRMTQSEAEEHVINMVTGVNGYKYIEAYNIGGHWRIPEYVVFGEMENSDISTTEWRNANVERKTLLAWKRAARMHLARLCEKEAGRASKF